MTKRTWDLRAYEKSLKKVKNFKDNWRTIKTTLNAELLLRFLKAITMSLKRLKEEPLVIAI
jgi:hypothetical protein